MRRARSIITRTTMIMGMITTMVTVTGITTTETRR